MSKKIIEKIVVISGLILSGLFVFVGTLDSAISNFGVKKGVISWLSCVAIVLIIFGIIRYYSKRGKK